MIVLVSYGSVLAQAGKMHLQILVSSRRVEVLVMLIFQTGGN